MGPRENHLVRCGKRLLLCERSGTSFNKGSSLWWTFLYDTSLSLPLALPLSLRLTHSHTHMHTHTTALCVRVPAKALPRVPDCGRTETEGHDGAHESSSLRNQAVFNSVQHGFPFEASAEKE
jgi:hypothetical protein